MDDQERDAEIHEDAASDTGEAAGEDCQDRMARTRERINEAIDEAEEELKAFAEEAREELGTLGEKARKELDTLCHRVAEFLDDAPWERDRKAEPASEPEPAPEEG